MTELLITSSVLILAVLAVRRLLAKRISKRLQYALWGLVLLRLLLPFGLPQSRASVMNYLPAAPAAAAVQPQAVPAQPGPAAPSEAQPAAERQKAAVPPLTGRQMLFLGWALGAFICGGWLAAANLRFGRMLRRRSRAFSAPGCPLPVYLCEEGLSTPCLYGLLRPAIYLTPQAMEDKSALNWVLLHEQTHWRHGDQVWGALRCVCLAAYWFDPLVWAAALASKKDCELACDEAVTRHAPEAERLSYGRALVALVPARAPAGQRLVSATIQSFSAGQMKQRVEAIAKNKKPVLWALLAALALAALAAVCTFTGARGLAASDPKRPPEYLAEGETVWYRARWEIGEDLEGELVLAKMQQAPGWGRLYYAVPAQGKPSVTVLFEGECSDRESLFEAWQQGTTGYAHLYTRAEGQKTWVLDAGQPPREARPEEGIYPPSAVVFSLYPPEANPQAQLDALKESILYQGGGLQFTVPTGYTGPSSDWQIQVNGRREAGGMGMSVHLFEQENAGRTWEPGKTYFIIAEELEGCTELYLEASLTTEGDGLSGEAGTLSSTGTIDLLEIVRAAQGGRFEFLQPGEQAVQTLTQDLNGDGKQETLVLSREPGDDLPYGRLYYVQENGEHAVLFEGNYTENGLQTAAMDTGETLFWLEETSGGAGGTAARLWAAVNKTGSWADAVTYDLPEGMGLTYQGGGRFTLYHHAYDMLEMDGSLSGASDKPYYFSWAGEGAGLVEYGGQTITEAQLRRLAPNPSNPDLAGLLEQVKKKGEITGILYRENGVVNINYKVAEGDTVSYHNLNLLLQNGAFSLIAGNQHPETSAPLETSDFGGVYLARIS